MLQPHPYASVFPMIPEHELEELANDIRENGLENPILLYDGKILDGRNRYEACRRAGVEPTTEDSTVSSDEEALALVVSLNIRRRHLDESARAIVAARLLPMFEVAAKERMREAGERGRETQKGGEGASANLRHPTPEPEKASAQAARLMSVSPRSVQAAKAVLTKATPQLIEACERGTIPINAGAKLAQETPEKQARVIELVTSGKAKSAEAAVRKSNEESDAHARADKRNRGVAHLRETMFDLRHGDFREVLSDIRDARLILTDPPYPGEFLELWRDLGKFAADALAEDGMLVAYSGQLYLPQVLSMLSESLTYWWTGAVIHAGTGNLMTFGHPRRNIVNQWKPVVIFGRKGGAGNQKTYRDKLDGAGAEKTHHSWQQPVAEAKFFVEQFTDPGDLVVDPFAGSGAFCKAAHECGRIAIGAEILECQ